MIHAAFAFLLCLLFSLYSLPSCLLLTNCFTLLQPLHSSDHIHQQGKSTPIAAVQQREHARRRAGTRAMREFSYEEVEAATGGFAAKNLVGKGSHGSVYRASLRGGGGGRRVVFAVKRPSHEQGEAKLANEIAVLSAAPRHPGVVGLVGVAAPQHQPPAEEDAGSKRVLVPSPPLLVMEYVPNGSLHDLLHRSPRPPPWPRRVEIALDVAGAVRALHAAVPRVIHRDVKSANILLGRDGRARLADFSLAVRVAAPDGREGARDSSDEDAGPAPAGTIGYLDPCYTEPGRLGPESDVFSFGVVLLELVSGRKVMDVNSCPSSIVAWAEPLIGAGREWEVFDARVAAPPTARAERAVARVLAVAARCVSGSVECRPAMSEVVSELRGVLERAGWRRGYTRRVVERAYRRVVSWGQHVRRSKRVRATKIECTEHSECSGAAPDPEESNSTSGAPK
ncbi:serine/threonine-protein kinase-like protein At5g23170 [Phragmites australis]|uniref:serine/threonine-protein kinase-like protein At5g23170 n=1 Tax=Phragmites australis TaxID=29695 RepID=UPI002D77F1C6|nr:serine/threonine-protein kinase-like protein At5g23170 [Phragmites australis]